MRQTLKNIWKMLRLSFRKFSEEATMNMAAALAYYTIFSLPPILIILVNITGLFVDRDTIKQQLYTQFGDLVGKSGADQLLATIEGIGLFNNSSWTALLSAVILVFTSTTVFSTIKRSLNYIFRVRSKPRSSIIKEARDRLVSFAMVLVLGFMLMVSLVINALFNVFNEYLIKLVPQAKFLSVELTSIAAPAIISVVLFALLFRILPDAKIKWKDAFMGAFVTAVLFSLGKYAIGYYVSQSKIATVYDAAGSVLILMVWIFYSSAIFFYGAQITYVYANIFGSTVRPSKNAVRITVKEAEADEFF